MFWTEQTGSFIVSIETQRDVIYLKNSKMILEKYRSVHFKKVCPLGANLFHVYGRQTDTQT